MYKVALIERLNEKVRTKLREKWEVGTSKSCINNDLAHKWKGPISWTVLLSNFQLRVRLEDDEI
jgi:hypothetical protein